MLQKIRDHLTGWVAILLFGLIMLTFVFWGIDFSGSTLTYAAKVNGEEIPLQEVQNAVRNQVSLYRQYSQGEISPAQEAQIRARVVDGLVRVEVLQQHARRQGYRISDQALAASIQELTPFQVNGEFDPDTYRRLLSLQGQSTTGFEEEYRGSLVVDQLQGALTRTSFATPAELRRRAELENEEREFAYLQFASSDFSDEVEVSEEEIEARYERDADRYMTQETVTVEYLEVTNEMLADEVELDEADVRAQYDADLAAGGFQAPEERKTRHILITVQDGDEDAARARAEEIAGLARDGGDFAALAQENSADSATAPDGGDLGWVQREMMVGAFSEALFDMETGEIRGPVRTEFGFHVIALEETRGGETQSFESVRDQIESDLRLRRAEGLFFERAELLADLAFESLDSLEPAAEELGLTIQTVPNVTRVGGSGLAANPIVRQTAFDPRVLDLGENSDIIEVTPEQAVVLRVGERKPSEQQPLEDVRDRVESQLRAEALRARAAERGEEMMARIRDGADLLALSAETGAAYNAPQTLRRVQSAVPRELIDAIFDARKPQAGQPTVGGLSLAGGDYVVYSLMSTIPGALAAATDERSRQIADQMGSSDLSAYINDLSDDASVVVAPPPEPLQ